MDEKTFLDAVNPILGSMPYGGGVLGLPVRSLSEVVRELEKLQARLRIVAADQDKDLKKLAEFRALKRSLATVGEIMFPDRDAPTA